MSETPEITRCSKGLMRGYHIVQCHKSATVERDGLHFCTIHDPVRRAEKDAARSAEWEKKHKENRKRHQLEAAAPDLLAALKALLAFSQDPKWSEDGSTNSTAWADAEAAIAKAEGRS